MNVLVYHAVATKGLTDEQRRDVMFSLGFAPKIAKVKTMLAEKLISYDLVAKVTFEGNLPRDEMAMAMEIVFEKTNTINSYWWENKDVEKMFAGDGCRSTSCGDVVKMEDGTFWIVAQFGFECIGKDFL